MIYLIYTTLLVAALALVMIFKIVAYIAKERHSMAWFNQVSAEMRPTFIYPEEFEEIRSDITYTNNRDLLFQFGYPIGRVEFVPDEDVRKAIIKRKVVAIGSYMLENGFIKVNERSLLGMGYPPDIKYIELTAKVLKPKD